MFCTLISSFEQLFPGNDQVWGRLLLFLTPNMRVGDYGMSFSASYVVDAQVVSRDKLIAK